MQKIQTIIDQLLQLQTKNHILTKIQILRSQNKTLYSKTISHLKNNLLNQPQYHITITKLYILEIISQLEASFDLLSFKTSTIYQLAAVSQGCVSAGLDVKGNFSRNLKKTHIFWGVSNIQNVYLALISKSTPTIGQSIQLQCKKYLWKFIKTNQELFPANFDIYQYTIKHMLMLRYDRKPQAQLYNLILQILQKYQYNEQVIRRNFRYMLEFFRTSFTEKQLGFLPHLSVMHMIKGYSNNKIDSMLAIGSLGLNWQESEVHNCINNVLKLGITDNSYRLLKAFIQMFKSAKKYHQLVQSFQKNLSKVFVFLKFPQLYQPSLKTLKQFILGPWNLTNLYSIFATKTLQYCKLKNSSLDQDFYVLLACVIEKYKQSTLVTELQEIIKANFKETVIDPQSIRKQILQYDWKIFDSIKQSAIKDKSSIGSINQLRGIVNIGNCNFVKLSQPAI